MKIKEFEHPPIVFENYHIFEYSTYRVLPMEIQYTRTMPAPAIYIFRMLYLYFLESHDSFVLNPKSQHSEMNS